jgi:heptosyltransferase-2
LARRLRQQRHTSALLLPNSFRSALLARLAGIPNRVGYARDYRSILLSHRLTPPREGGRFKIESMLCYYARLAESLGCPAPCGPLELHTDAVCDAQIERWWQEFGIAGGRPVVVLNPGAAFGASKLYPAERFAAVGEALATQVGARILITAGPNETAIAEAVQAAMSSDAVVLAPPRLNLRLLKSLIARASLLITNDTGPRHFAIAFGVPVVTIFGPTHPEWTETHYHRERQVAVPVECGPCQLPICPLDHRCMTGIPPQRVVDAAKELLRVGPEY